MASPLAALLWPIVVIASGSGFSSNFTVTASALLTVAFFGLLGGVAVSVLLGFPLLILAEHFRVNRIPVLAIAGSSVSVLLGLAASWPAEAWLVYVFFGLLGASCGAVASWGSQARAESHAEGM